MAERTLESTPSLLPGSLQQKETVTVFFTTPVLLRDPGHKSGRAQAPPKGYSSNDVVSPSHGEVPHSPHTGVSLQLQRSCWQPHWTHRGTPQSWGDQHGHRSPQTSREIAHTLRRICGDCGRLSGPTRSNGVPEWERAPDTWKPLTHPEWRRGLRTGPRAGWAASWGLWGQEGRRARCCSGPSCAGLQAVACLQGWSPDVPLPVVPLGPRDSLHAGELETGDCEGEKVHHGQAQEVDRTLGGLHSLLQPFLPSPENLPREASWIYLL